MYCSVFPSALYFLLKVAANVLSSCVCVFFNNDYFLGTVEYF